MTSQRSISVIIPAFNEENYLPACLESIVPQLGQNDEIIVVNNNSTDQTAAVAKRAGVRVVHEPKQGLSYARNTGIRAARNQIIARTDADSSVLPGWVERIRTLDPSEAKLITGPVYLKELLPIKFGLHNGITKKKLGFQNTIGANMAFTKKAWNKISPQLYNDDATYAEDTEVTVQAHQKGIQVVFMPEMIVYTSWRRMIQNPIKNYLEWRRKLRNTVGLTRKDK